MIESEKLLERKLADKVKAKGGWALKLPATFVDGIPDRLVLCPDGTVEFVEMKTNKEKPRKLQRAIHKKLRKMNFSVHVIDTTEGINDFIRRATARIPGLR